MQHVDCTIIVPVYYNEGSLKPLFKNLKEKVIDQNKDKVWEVIFVDDGSGDNSLKELLELKNESQELIKVIRFTRNFGQFHARKAGMKLSTGKCIIHTTADLQDPPELINEMLHYHFNENYEIIAGERDGREESLYRRITSRIFYQIMRKLTFPNMPLGGFDYVLISEKVKNVLLENNEAMPFMQGQILWTGYRIKFIPYKRRKREIGKSKWTFGKKLTLLIDGILGYSFIPLRMMIMVGISVSLLGFIYAIYILVERLVQGVNVQGWAPLMIVILILSGIQMLMVGVIGEYVWRTLDQVRNRPDYIIERVYD